MRGAATVLLVSLACATAVSSMRERIQQLQGHSADDVIRELGAPVGQYQLPQSRHVVYVYEAQRVHRGSVAGTMLSGMGSGMTGQPNTVQPRNVSCQFELEFGDDGKLLGTTQRGEGC